MGEVEVRRVPGADAEAGRVRGELGAVFREVFAEPPYEYGEEHVELFLERFDRQRQVPGAALALARDDGGDLAGFAFGLPLRSADQWWPGLTTEVDPVLVEEWPGRTFALIELLVRAPWRGSGVASRLHDEILADRPEERATLTTMPGKNAAQHAYERWGWRKVAQKRNPLPGSPVYDVLIKHLHR